MAKLRVTADAVAAVMNSPRANRTAYYFDDDLAGFGFYRTPGNVGTFFAEFRPVAGGSKKRIKLGRVGTLKAKEAREAARKAIANAALGKDLAMSRTDERASVTVQTLVADYIARKEMKPATRSFYKITLYVHIAPTIGSLKAVALTRVDVQKAHTSISKRGKYSANRAVALLSASFGWGAKHGYVPEGFNPASRVDRNREEARERFLTADELHRLGAAMVEAETIGLPDHNPGAGKHAPKNRRTLVSPHVTAAIRLLMLTGARLREVLNLRWSEVDLERALLTLPDSKTGKKIILLPAAAVVLLQSLPRITGDSGVGVYVIASDSAGQKDERPRADIKRPWSAITKRAGVSGLRAHDLRHSFASMGAWEGLGLPVIGSLLGHADAGTTAKYAHVADEAARRAVNVIGGKIAAAMNGGAR